MARQKKVTLAAKRARGQEGSGTSRYALKMQWLNSHPVPGSKPAVYRFGFQVAHPTPWR